MPSIVDPACHARRILHVDMDAFYASVEQRDDPALHGRPVAVGGARARGVVAAASYEARVFGVRSAMPSVTARRKCPELVFVPPRFDVYRTVSAQIHAIFARYTALIQPLSLDEAYLDVTAPLIDAGSATAIAALIRAEIREQTGLTASAGVSYNKLLAKLASGYRKPDGLFVITPRMGPDFVATLPVGRFHGVGPVTAAKMNRLGIITGQDLRMRTLAELTTQFGKAGPYYYGMARAQDDRRVEPDRERKSIGAETTFTQDLLQWHDVPPAIAPLIEKVWRVYARDGLVARTLTVKVKHADFKIATRSRTFEAPIAALPMVEGGCLDLLRPFFPSDRGVRLLGVGLSNIGEAGRQLALTLG